jgi:hypothetical protein
MGVGEFLLREKSQNAFVRRPATKQGKRDINPFEDIAPEQEDAMIRLPLNDTDMAKARKRLPSLDAQD